MLYNLHLLMYIVVFHDKKEYFFAPGFEPMTFKLSVFLPGHYLPSWIRISLRPKWWLVLRGSGEGLIAVTITTILVTGNIIQSL